jgi:serine/threonine protein kinase
MGGGRAALWSLAILSAVTTGMAARVPVSFTLVAIAMAFLPAGMRKMTVPRWLVGGAAWVVTALLVSFATRGAPATFTRAVLFGIAPGIALFFAVFLLGYTSRSPHRDTAAELEGGALGGYQLKRRLGAGGMGEVWEAQHPALKVSVAVKLLRIQSRVARGRFEREARVTAQLRSPHTVSLFDYGLTADGAAYYAMELLDGVDLESLVARHGPVEPARAIHFLRQACDSLAEAHELGLVHRDVKPANMIVQRTGRARDAVKVLDFGLVYRGKAGATGERFTRPGTVVGTPSYLAPEASAGGNATPAADVYSLGCLLYFLLTGAPPFVGETVPDVLAAHVKDPVVPPEQGGLRDLARGRRDRARVPREGPEEPPAYGRRPARRPRRDDPPRRLDAPRGAARRAPEPHRRGRAPRGGPARSLNREQLSRVEGRDTRLGSDVRWRWPSVYGGALVHRAREPVEDRAECT